ncbi:MAG TPA: DUF1707 domain-containing protein [Streptosporangiaceae bacterium]|jgi:hypothetical protein|nr:DUF1707 domain-containing protein [Streptosporangiaceae bacterium]
MSASRSTSWIAAASRRRVNYGDMRISDAERAEVVDLLSTHYEDGRLDQAEFDQRLDQAMKARTYKDLNGLFNDLPLTGGPSGSGGSGGAGGRGSAGVHQVPGQQGLGRFGGRGHRVLFLILVVAVVAVARHVLVWSLTPWVWIGLVCAVILLATRSPGRTP